MLLSMSKAITGIHITVCLGKSQVHLNTGTLFCINVKKIRRIGDYLIDLYISTVTAVYVNRYQLASFYTYVMTVLKMCLL